MSWGRPRMPCNEDTEAMNQASELPLGQDEPE